MLRSSLLALRPLGFTARARTAGSRAAAVCFSSSAVRATSFPATISDDGVATLTMSNAPVNAFGTEDFKDFTEAVKALEDNPDVHAMVLTSSIKGIFSAGLDVTCIIGTDEAGYVRSCLVRDRGLAWTSLT